MKLIFTTIAALVFSANISAQCNPSTDKMMVMGDSWAFFSWSGNSYNENLDRFGFSDYKCYSTAGLAVNGTEASDYFTDAPRVQELTDYINSNPDLKIVHFSLGGNDLLRTWNNSMNSAQVNGVLDAVMVDIKAGIDEVLAINPDLQILLSGYDIPNFSETVGALPALLQSQHPFFSTWDNMGQPNPTEINTMLTTGTQRFIDSTNTWPNVHFVNNIGLMQNTYGNASSSFGTYAAGTAPVPGGFIDKPSPTEALNFAGNDSFHLNDDSYELFIKRHFEEFYWAYFRDADQTFSADITANNGWVTTTATNTTSVKVGNHSSEAHSSILSFNTVSMPNLEKASKGSIFIKRSSLNGTNLIDQDLTVSVAVNHFGDSEAIELMDLTDAGDATAVSCIYGVVEEDGDWLRIDLDDALLPFMNRYGTTQFKLSFESVTDADRYFEFSNNPDDIYLDLNLVEDLLSVEDEILTDVTIYPNPVNSELTIKGIDENSEVKIIDLNGRVVAQQNSGANTIDVSNLVNGMYMISIKTNNQIITKKFSKI